MNQAVAGSFPCQTTRTWSPTEPSVRDQVRGILAALYPETTRSERRREERWPFPRLVHLQPMADDGVTPAGLAVTAAGKHLSEKGLGFYHPSPFPYRLAVVSLERADEQRLSFLLDITWTRFGTQGWYESGGRFLRPVPRKPE